MIILTYIKIFTYSYRINKYYNTIFLQVLIYFVQYILLKFLLIYAFNCKINERYTILVMNRLHFCTSDNQ